MGEMAEMMLDGTLCTQCGAFLGEGDGFPVTCPGCQGDARGMQHPAQQIEKPKRNRTKRKRRKSNGAA